MENKLEPIKSENKIKTEKIILPEPTQLEKEVLEYHNAGHPMDRICAYFMMNKSEIESILNKF